MSDVIETRAREGGSAMPEVRHPGAIILEWLSQHRHTQAALARELGITEKHLSQIVRGRSLFSLALADRLEAVTGIPALQLLAAKDEYELERRRRAAR